MNVEASHFIVELEHTITSTQHFSVSVASHTCPVENLATHTSPKQGALHASTQPCLPLWPALPQPCGLFTTRASGHGWSRRALTLGLLPPGGTCPSAPSRFQCPRGSKAAWPQTQQLTKPQMVIMPE